MLRTVILRAATRHLLTSGSMASTTKAALIDSHCHLQDERLTAIATRADAGPTPSRLPDVLRRASAAGVSHVVSCACHQQDWAALKALLTAQQQEKREVQIVPAFGLHPWWAHDLEDIDQLLDQLRRTLGRHPTAPLGEIGLCKTARGRAVPLAVQTTVFRAQLSLAAELERTCVLHCVGHYGKLLDLLTQAAKSDGLPPTLVLHSYSGSPEMLRAFLSLRGTRVFFSLNAKQLVGARASKATACCAAMPLTALLLETDAPDQAPSVQDVEQWVPSVSATEDAPLLLQERVKGVNEPAMVRIALLAAAQIRGISADELAKAVRQNSKEAFGLV